MRLFALALILPTIALSQPRRPVDPAEPARRAAEGKARLEATPAGKKVLASIERHGGLTAWFTGRALAFRYTYQPLGDKPARDSVQTVDLLGARAYHDMTSPMKGQIAWDGQRAWATFDPHKGAARFWALTPYYFVGMPFVLGDPGINLSISTDDPAAAGLPPADVIKVTFDAGTGDAPDDYYVVYLAKDDARLLGLRYVVSYKAFMKGDKKHGPEKLVVYADPKPAGPLTIPRRHDFYAFPDGKRGDKITVATVAQVQYAAPFDEARLDLPTGGQIDRSLDGK